MANFWRSGYVSTSEIDNVLKAATDDGWTIVQLDPKFSTGDRSSYFLILNRTEAPPSRDDQNLFKDSGWLRTRRPRDTARV